MKEYKPNEMGRRRLPFPEPLLREDRCLRSGAGWSRCDACFSACPVEGFSLEPIPRVPDGCVSCHFCTARCPEGAWEGELPPLNADGHPHREYRCGMVTVEGVPAVPCVGAVPRFFVRCLRRSRTNVTIFTGDCSRCALHRGWESFSALVRMEGVQEWIRMESRADAAPPTGRRNLFDLVGRSLHHTIISLRDYPGYDASRRGRVAPGFLDSCIGCTLCEMVCPEEVLSRKAGDDGVEIRVSPERCTGCRKCIDSCRFGGLTLTAAERGAKPAVYFFPTRACSRCGIRFEGGMDLCPGCRAESAGGGEAERLTLMARR